MWSDVVSSPMMKASAVDVVRIAVCPVTATEASLVPAPKSIVDVPSVQTLEPDATATQFVPFHTSLDAVVVDQISTPLAAVPPGSGEVALRATARLSGTVKLSWFRAMLSRHPVSPVPHQP